MARVTIYSVAKACGVSSSTVSRAFSRPDMVRDDVRTRILETAERMGYRPNRSARAVATGRNSMIGLVVPDITNPFMPPLVRAVQQAATGIDCSVLLVDAAGSGAVETQLMTQLRDQVDGLVVVAPQAASEVLRRAADGLPCVLINRRVRGLPAVTWDTGPALSVLGEHLTGLGHRVIALMRGPSSSWAAGRRAATIRSWSHAAGATLVEHGPFDASFDGGREAGQALLASEATAAFAFDDVTACGMIAELAVHGARVPAEFSIVGCDDVLLARMVTPALTTVTAPVERLGWIAVDILRDRIADPAGEGPVRSVEGHPAIRGSTGPPPNVRVP